MAIIDGPGSSIDYRSVWHALQRIRASRSLVEEVVRELDPNEVEARKAHKLRGREYICAGPNKVWYADGYDNLNSTAFPFTDVLTGIAEKVFGCTLLGPTTCLITLQPITWMQFASMGGAT